MNCDLYLNDKLLEIFFFMGPSHNYFPVFTIFFLTPSPPQSYHSIVMTISPFLLQKKKVVLYANILIAVHGISPLAKN